MSLGITPIEVRMSSIYPHVWNGHNLTGDNCMDGSLEEWSICHTAVDGTEKYPWLVLVIPRSTVYGLKITNRRDGGGELMKNMKIWVGSQFPSSTDEEYSGESLLGTYTGPGTNGEVLYIYSEEGRIGSHVVVQMESNRINLAEIEVFGEKLDKCIDTGCKEGFSTGNGEAECVNLKNVNWTHISQTFNVSAPWREGLCMGANTEEDCCKCLPRLPLHVGCVDVREACQDAFGGFGVCKNYVKDDMSHVDFYQGSKRGFCNVNGCQCCECFSLKQKS